MEKWKKAEEEFHQLPLTPLPGSTPLPTPRDIDSTHSTHSRSISHDVPRPSNTANVLKPLRKSEDGPPPPAGTRTVPGSVTAPVASSSGTSHDEVKDRELAAQIQAQLAKELEQEDEKKAQRIAASLQRQWEAEDEREGDGQKVVHLVKRIEKRVKHEINLAHQANFMVGMMDTLESG